MDRESTNFPLELARFLATVKWSPRFNCLYYHQNIARVYFGLPKTRGLLIDQGTGMGKSFLAASLVIDAVFPPDADVKPRKVVILLAKSLASNMMGAIEDYLDMLARSLSAEPSAETPRGTLGAILALPREKRREWISRGGISFVTMNASNMMEQMRRVTSLAEEDEDLLVDEKAAAIISRATKLDNRLLIVDEAHGLFRAIINGSRNAAALYERVMAAKNIKIAFLTGTPIASHPFELAMCFNMLAGKQLFPIHFDDFARFFISAESHTMRNRAAFQNRILGLVSYVSSSSTPGIGANDIVDAISANDRALEVGLGATKPRENDIIRVEFPEEYPLELVRVEMDMDQWNAYLVARETERTEGMQNAERVMGGAAHVKVITPMRKWMSRETPALQKPRSDFSSTYRVHSRQIGNYCPPPNIRKLIRSLSEEHAERDWEQILGQIENIESVKFRAILEKLRGRHAGQLGIIYSQFVGIGGLAALARFLDQNGFAQKWALISGEVAVDERARIIARFCAPDNAHAEHIALLLISATGAEGIDLKNVRHVHILEPYWNYGRIKQVKARAIRNGSHTELPQDERNVATYIYMVIAPRSRLIPAGGEETVSRIDLEMTSDEELYENARTGQLLIDSFESALREVSIECALNHTSADRAKLCRICAPNSAELFTDNLARDIESSDPCRETASVQIRAQKIKIGDITFYYRVATPGSIEERAYGYELYVEDVALHAWRKLGANDPRYGAIIAEIRARK